MKSFSISLIVLIAFCALAFGFAPMNSSLGSGRTSIQRSVAESNTKLFFFGQPKDDGSPGDYVCKDCGYVFTKGPAAWAKLDDKYQCPPCGAPKFRFKKVPKGSASGKVEVKKNWFGN
mmetsp:Transcript_23496/g.34944  ORF Transcript_23496/g.34944 Transcript_23496/m.34944 type:complete len:118 (+) Transcript_23496:88-441(+)